MPYKDPDVRREYMRTWVAARRAAYFAGKVCVDCGRGQPDVKLELDHIDPEMKISHRIWSWSDVRRDAELEKCAPRCEECHLIKTVKSLQRPMVHGSDRMYDSGCRCDECRKFKRLKNFRIRHTKDRLK